MNKIRALIGASIFTATVAAGAGGEVYAGLSGCSATRVSNTKVTATCLYSTPGSPQRVRAWGIYYWGLTAYRKDGPCVYVMQTSAVTTPTPILVWGYSFC